MPLGPNVQGLFYACASTFSQRDRWLLDNAVQEICTGHGNRLKIEVKASIGRQLSLDAAFKKRESVDMHGPRSRILCHLALEHPKVHP